jgi:hypothetical protein
MGVHRIAEANSHLSFPPCQEVEKKFLVCKDNSYIIYQGNNCTKVIPDLNTTIIYNNSPVSIHLNYKDGMFQKRSVWYMVNCIYSSWHFSLGRLATAKGDHLCYPEHRIFIKWRCHIGYMCLLLFFSVYQRYLLTGSNYKFCFSLRQHDRSTAFH